MGLIGAVIIKILRTLPIVSVTCGSIYSNNSQAAIGDPYEFITTPAVDQLPEEVRAFQDSYTDILADPQQKAPLINLPQWDVLYSELSTEFPQLVQDHVDNVARRLIIRTWTLLQLVKNGYRIAAEKELKNLTRVIVELDTTLKRPIKIAHDLPAHKIKLNSAERGDAMVWIFATMARAFLATLQVKGAEKQRVIDFSKNILEAWRDKKEVRRTLGSTFPYYYVENYAGYSMFFLFFVWLPIFIKSTVGPDPYSPSLQILQFFAEIGTSTYLITIPLKFWYFRKNESNLSRAVGSLCASLIQ